MALPAGCGRSGAGAVFAGLHFLGRVARGNQVGDDGGYAPSVRAAAQRAAGDAAGGAGGALFLPRGSGHQFRAHLCLLPRQPAESAVAIVPRAAADGGHLGGHPAQGSGYGGHLCRLRPVYHRPPYERRGGGGTAVCPQRVYAGLFLEHYVAGRVGVAAAVGAVHGAYAPHGENRRLCGGAWVSAVYQLLHRLYAVCVSGAVYGGVAAAAAPHGEGVAHRLRAVCTGQPAGRRFGRGDFVAHRPVAGSHLRRRKRLESLREQFPPV